MFTVWPIICNTKVVQAESSQQPSEIQAALVTWSSNTDDDWMRFHSARNTHPQDTEAYRGLLTTDYSDGKIGAAPEPYQDQAIPMSWSLVTDDDWVQFYSGSHHLIEGANKNDWTGIMQ